VDLDVADQQQIQIDRPRPLGDGAVAHPPEDELQRQQAVEERHRIDRAGQLDLEHGVEEPRLVGHWSDRCAAVDRRPAHRPHLGPG